MHRGKTQIVIVTPALADANNGNWQTARRWARMLSSAYRVRLAARWDAGDESLLIALHARRSAASVAAWRQQAPRRPLVVALTGTDLYRDIAIDTDAQASLQAADALVVLNELGAQQLPAGLRHKSHVVLQSASARQALDKPKRHLRALMVGHLRDEKDPRTYFRAARRLERRTDILLDHAGSALDRQLGAEAQALDAAQSNYRWLGGIPHAEARQRIQAAHVLVHPSRMEGGAHVVIEAVRSATPVLASRIAGNVGLLGAAYAGVFDPGDDAALSAWLERLRDDPDMLVALRAQTEARAALFAPSAEQAALHRIVSRLLS
jgi:putative glycosyltransferase (TIGR04348 family)